MTYPATVVNDLENVEGTNPLLGVTRTILADIFISGACPFGSNLFFRFILLASDCRCLFLFCGVHTRSAAERHRCGHWLLSNGLLLFVDYGNLSWAILKSFVRRGIFVGEYSDACVYLWHHFHGSWRLRGRPARSIRANRTRLTRTGKVNINSLRVCTFRGTVRVSEAVANSWKFIFFSICAMWNEIWLLRCMYYALGTGQLWFRLVRVLILYFNFYEWYRRRTPRKVV